MLLLARVGTIGLLLYALLGAHYSGILIPEIRLLSLLVLLVLVGGWFYLRTRLRWVWQRTPLDQALPLWGAAFGLSLLVNLDASHRILTALWYMGLYVGLWYLLHDLLANWKPMRGMVVDGLLVVGSLFLLSSVVEWYIAIQLAGEDLFAYRFGGLFGNPNLFGTMLMVLVLVALGRLFACRSNMSRVLWGGYVLLAALGLFLTDSRSAWLGTGIGLVTWVLLAQGIRVVRRWWRSRKRVLVITVGMLLGFAFVLVLFRLLDSFDTDGRGFALRPQLISAAWSMFLDKPLTGQGLFTFGRHQPLHFSLPPGSAHTHAHNIVFQMAGELGVGGLMAGLGTVVLMLRAAWSARYQMDGAVRADWAAAGSAVVGLGVVQLLDVTAMLPLIALIFMLVLALAVSHPTPLLSQRWQAGRRIGLVGLWAILFAAGGWDALWYRQYEDMLTRVSEDRQYGAAATRLQTIADSDPRMVIYPAQQAFLWGLAAQDGDDYAYARAIMTYERVIKLEPYYAPYYANLGALYWNTDDHERGLAMMQVAADLAPASWALQYNVAVAAESLGQDDIARAAYARTVAADPDVDLLPEWGQTALQTEFSSALDAHSLQAQIVLLMEAGETKAAAELWDAELASSADVRDYVVRMLVALADGERKQAQAWYDRAHEGLPSWETEAWLRLGQARLAQFDGDEAGAAAALAQLREWRAYDPFAYDYIAGPDMAYYQYFRRILPRQFLPQVYYPLDRILLLHLLNKS